jgi:DNA-binding transcriptional LysR family regulator
MDLRQLRYFVVLAETLNFRRAAERLNLSQPPLTVAIRKLEAELGSPLFTRSNRGVALTPEGEAALGPARLALAQSDQVRHAVRAQAQAQRGRLTVGFASAAYALLPRLAPAFRRRYPQAELVLEEASSMEIGRRIRLRQLDAGLVRLPMQDPVHMETTVIETDELVAAVPDTHALARRRMVSLGQLAEEPFISYSPDDTVHGSIVAACQAAGFTPRVVQQAAQTHTVISLVQSGLGVGLAPSGIRYTPEGVKLLRLVEHVPIELGLALPRDTTNALALGLRAVAQAELKLRRPSRPAET